MSEDVLRIGILGDAEDVHVRRWCAGLAARGLEICNVCGRLPIEKLGGVEYLEFRTPGFGRRYPHRKAVRFRQWFQSLFRRFDIIHVHNLNNWGIDEEIASCGRLMVSTYGDDVLGYPTEENPREVVVDHSPHTARMKKLALRLADQVTATSAFLADATGRYAEIPREEIEVVHFGVDTQVFCPQRRQPAEVKRVGFFGGFVRLGKGPRFLLEAAPIVWRRFPDCQFDLFGSGGSRSELERQAQARGYGRRIRFPDFVPHSGLPHVLEEINLVAIPSTFDSESYCVMAVEAQAMRVPVVASRVGGLPETVLDGRTGILVAPRSPVELARGICELLGDEQKRRAFGRAGRQWVMDQHNWSDSLDRMIDAYHRVVTGSPRRTRSATTCSW